MNIGQAIRENRKGLNMTQAELADQLEVSQETIANYEAGRREPSIDIVAAMAHIFGIAIDDLVTPHSYMQDQNIRFEGTLAISESSGRKRGPNAQEHDRRDGGKGIAEAQQPGLLCRECRSIPEPSQYRIL